MSISIKDVEKKLSQFKFNEENGFECTEDGSVYDMAVNEIQMIYDRNASNGTFDKWGAICDAYKLGYMKATGVIPAIWYTD